MPGSSTIQIIIADDQIIVAEGIGIMLTLRHYFPEWVNRVRRPMGKKYPTDPQTIGKQLLKRRMDLRLLQKMLPK